MEKLELGALKMQVLENASTENVSKNVDFGNDGNACTENVSTDPQGWKMQVLKL